MAAAGLGRTFLSPFHPPAFSLISGFWRSISLRDSLAESLLPRPSNNLSLIRQLQNIPDVRHVVFHCSFADKEALPHFCVLQALGNQVQHFDLPFVQKGKPLAWRRRVGLTAKFLQDQVFQAGGKGVSASLQFLKPLDDFGVR